MTWQEYENGLEGRLTDLHARIHRDWAKVSAFGSVGFTEWLGAALGTPRSGADLQTATTYTFIVSGIASLLLAVAFWPPKSAAEIAG